LTQSPPDERGPAAAVPKQVVAAILVRNDGRLLVCQRTKHQPMPLKWEFPGGKIEADEEPRAALHRELEEELGIRATIGKELSRFVHTYKNGGQVDLRFFVVREWDAKIDNRIFKQVLWVYREELTRLDFLEADLTLVRDIAAGKVL
jgi:8-oxo-dGTP diphosphatase